MSGLEKPVLNPLLSRKSGATEIYLIRHGDALPEADRAIPGAGYDNQPLSRLGQSQALALGRWLSGVGFEALYSSPLRRCTETAAPLAQLLDLPVNIEQNLREVRLGLDIGGPATDADSGATSEALRTRMAAVIQRVGQEGKWSAIPGSEASAPFRRRVIEIVHELAARHPAQRLAVFSHGGFINAYAAEVLGLERDFFFPIHNTSVSIIRCLGWESSIFSLNDTAHFRVGEIDLQEL